MSLMTSGSTPDMRTEGGEDGWKDARQRTGGDGGSGHIPPSPVCVCGSQAKKRCCSPEGRVSLPESLWHLLQVLVSVGFKLHILNGGQSHKNTPNIMQYVAAKSGAAMGTFSLIKMWCHTWNSFVFHKYVWCSLQGSSGQIWTSAATENCLGSNSCTLSFGSYGCQDIFSFN